jgi:hypothetical protein
VGILNELVTTSASLTNANIVSVSLLFGLSQLAVNQLTSGYMRTTFMPSTCFHIPVIIYVNHIMAEKIFVVLRSQGVRTVRMYLRATGRMDRVSGL